MVIDMSNPNWDDYDGEEEDDSVEGLDPAPVPSNQGDIGQECGETGG